MSHFERDINRRTTIAVAERPAASQYHEWLEPQSVSFFRGTVQTMPEVSSALESASQEVKDSFENAEYFWQMKKSLKQMMGAEGLEEVAPKIKTQFDEGFPNGHRLGEVDNPELGANYINIKSDVDAFIDSLQNGKNGHKEINKELVSEPV